MKHKRYLLKSQQPLGMWLILLSIIFFTLGISTVFNIFATYAQNDLNIQHDAAYALSSGTFLFLFNFAALAGGIIGQKFGHRRIVSIGGIYTATGLAFISIHNLSLIGLATYAIGTGLILPNLYTTLSQLYTSDDIRRNAGFTIIYLGANFGILINSILAVLISKYIGYENTFLLAAISMILGTIVFTLSNSNLVRNPLIMTNEDKNRSKPNTSIYAILTLLIIITGITTYIIQNITFNLTAITIACLLSIFYLLYLVFKYKKKEENWEKRKLIGLLFILLLCLAFWFANRLSYIIFSQYSNLFLERKILFFDHSGINIVITIGLFFICLIGILMAFCWSRKKWQKTFLTILPVIALGLLINAIGFIALWVSRQEVVLNNHTQASYYLLIAVILISSSEILIAPIYFAMVGKLAPRKYESTIIGILQLFIGFAGIYAIAAVRFHIHTHVIMEFHQGMLQVIYISLAFILFFLAALAIIFTPLWKKKMYKPLNL